MYQYDNEIYITSVFLSTLKTTNICRNNGKYSKTFFVNSWCYLNKEKNVLTPFLISKYLNTTQYEASINRQLKVDF